MGGGVVLCGGGEGVLDEASGFLLDWRFRFLITSCGINKASVSYAE